MFKLVFISVVCLGISNTRALNSADASSKDQDVIKDASSLLNTKAGLLPKTQFHCHKRPSGYYADPRFNCEVFHYCHEDGTRVTIPCGAQDNHKHKICLLRDISYKDCDGITELYLALPQDLFFKASKDTTASALNGATDYKIPEVLSEPDEDRVSTTPLSSQEYQPIPDGRSSQDGGIYEVFNSFLKEIEGGLEASSASNPRTAESSRPRPSTFSRGSRFPSSLEPKDTLIDASFGRRLDGDGAFLVEIYNDEENPDDNDYSSYSRKSKKLFLTSDKKTPAKHPRRRKRTVNEQQFRRGHPYAIVYAKVPDTTFPTSLQDFGGIQSPTQERRAQFSSGEVPLVPVTIETKRRKKSKSKKKTPSSENQPQTNQQTSEQQNIYFYAPEQDRGAEQLTADGRTRIDPRQRIVDNRDPSIRQRLTNNPQQGQQPGFNVPSPYPNLPIPNFPFQAQQFANAPRQPPYFFNPQDGYSPFGPPPFGNQQQFQQHLPQNQQNQRPQARPQPETDSHQSATRGPQQSAGPSSEATRTTERPSIQSGPQGYQRFQNPFFESFSGFGGGAPFGGPYTQREPPSYSLLPPAQSPQQPPLLNQPDAFVQPGIPQHQPQSQLRPGISVALQPNQDPRLYNQGMSPHQDRTRHPSEDSQPQIIDSPERVPRNRIRPTSNTGSSLTQSPRRPQDDSQLQRPRQPSSDTTTQDRSRQRGQQYNSNNNRIVYQPEYIPHDLILQPENSPNILISNGAPQGQLQDSPRPVILLEDLTSQDRRPQNPDNNPKEIVYSQRQPIQETPREEYQRRPEQIRRPPQPQEDPRPQQPSRYYSPTTPPPSSRGRVRDRQPPRSERQRQRTRPVEESVVPNIVDENPEYGHRTSPSPDERPDNIRSRPQNNRVTNRYNPIPPSPPIPQRRPINEEIPSNEGRRPSSEGRRPSSEGRRPSSEGRRPSSEGRRPSNEGRRPSNEGRRPSSEVRRPHNEISDDHRQQTIRPSRYQSNPRERPQDGSQPQIERPPSEYIEIEPQPQIYSGPPSYYTYPPHGNEVNLVSTTDQLDDRPHTPPSTRQQLSHRQPTSNIRSQANNRIPELELGFIPMTEKPYQDSYYQTRQPSKEHNTEVVEEYNVPDKIQSNRYQDINEEPSTTRQTSTTRRPTQKPRPPPPKPTFPTFPTFPPPPRRPVTSPRPRTESTELKNENGDISEFASNDPDQLAEVVSRSKPQLESVVGSENLRNNKELAEGDFLRTDSPEVTTRRRTRKKKQRVKKIRPTTSYSDDGYTTVDIITQPTTEREIVSRSTSNRQNRWQKQTTPQPRRASVSTEEASTEASSAKAEEYGSRINLFGRQRSRNPVGLKPRVPSTTQPPLPTRGESSRATRTPTVTRTRKPLSNRVRTRTTTTTEYPETDGPIARSDENAEFLYYQSIDATTESTALPEYESATLLPLESTTESILTTEPYNEITEMASEVITSQPEDSTDLPQDENEKMGDFESTRAVAKKFQNRPRILKFGKPKLRSTMSPFDMNVSESRAF